MQVLLIINYNDYKNTKRLIENVADFKTINHVVVVDNCSTDDSYDKLLKSNLKAEIVKSEANKGYSYAINYGMKYIEKKYKQANVFISNSDIIIPTEDSLILMLKELKGNVGLVGPVVNEHGVLNRGWKMPTPMVDAFLNLVVVHNWVRKKKIFYKEDHYNDKVSRVDVVSGCFFLVNTKDFKNINYLDENVFLYYEENILASKLKSVDKFEVIVKVLDSKMTSKLIDIENDDEYILVDIQDSVGEFVGNVRENYENELKKIIAECTEKDVFKNNQTKDVIKYVKEKYEDDLEFLWEKFDDNAIIRNKINNIHSYASSI